MLFTLFSFFAIEAFAKVPSPEIDYADAEQQIVERSIDFFEQELHGTINIPVVVLNALRMPGLSVQQAMAEEEARGVKAIAIGASIDSAGRWQEVTTGHPDYCLVIFLRGGRIQPMPEKESTIAHETFHCFQFDWLGIDRTLMLPKWLIEGGAEFAGEHFSGGSHLGFERYADFFTNAISMPLFGLQYDALPYIMQLHLDGSNQYVAMKRAWYQSGYEPAWVEWATVTGADSLLKLTKAVKRKPDYGADWDLQYLDHIPNGSLPDEQTDAQTLPVQYPLERGRLKSTLIVLPQNKFVKIRFENGVGALRVDPWAEQAGTGAGETFNLKDGDSRVFCYGEYCGCPSGAESYNTIKSKDGLVLATGLSVFRRGTIYIEETSPGCCPGAERLDPRLVGTWEVDYKLFLENIFLPNFPGLIKQSVSGAHTVTVNRSGWITKNYNEFKIKREVHIMQQRTRKEEMKHHGGFAGCLSTRPLGPNRGWLELVNEQGDVQYTETIIATDAPVQVHTSIGEDPSVRWPAPGSTRGNYEFLDEKTFRIRGTTRTFLRQSR